ncbi:MAG: hypothetical protein ACXABG_03890 [Promethearchaeota archaeon]|jgi:membrane protein DedA with SNARE-associated domain
MKSFKEKFDLDEFLSILIGLSLAGMILMWAFYTTFPFWDPEVSLIHTEGDILYLSLAIVFTILSPLIFVLLWFRKKKA